MCNSDVHTVSLPVPHAMSPHYRAGYLTSGYLARLDLGKAPISAKSGGGNDRHRMGRHQLVGL